MFAVDTKELAQVAHALGDPTRLEILRLIVAGRDGAYCSPADATCPNGVCVCDIQGRLALGQSRVSYHVAELKAAGLVNETRLGRWNYYEVDEGRVRSFVEALMQLMSPASPSGGAAVGKLQGCTDQCGAEDD